MAQIHPLQRMHPLIRRQCCRASEIWLLLRPPWGIVNTNGCDVSSSSRQAGVAATVEADTGRGRLVDGWARLTVVTICFGEDASRRRQAYLLQIAIGRAGRER